MKWDRSTCRATTIWLLEKIEAGEIDPSFVITHRLPLEDAPEAYRTFRDKEGRGHQGGIDTMSTAGKS